jgi:hypothetical protein
MVRLKGLLVGVTAMMLGGVATIAGFGATTQPASAQAAYGSYVGAGATFGINDGPQGNGRQIGCAHDFL